MPARDLTREESVRAALMTFLQRMDKSRRIRDRNAAEHERACAYADTTDRIFLVMRPTRKDGAK